MNEFTNEEDRAIRRYYPEEGAERVARRLGRTPKSIVYRAGRLGVRRDPASLAKQQQTNLWTDQEIEILRRFYPAGPAVVRRELGRTRTLEAIKEMANKLGLRVDHADMQRRKGQTRTLNNRLQRTERAYGGVL